MSSRRRGCIVLSLQPKGAIAGLSFRLPRRTSVSMREFLVFNQELATLLSAGMPLVQSLDLLKRRVTSPVFRAVLEDVHERVRGGTALSDAFAAHGSLFPSVYTASLVAGERSGNLDAVLRRFVEYTKIIATVKRKTISALVYPAILITLAHHPRLDHRAEGRAGVLGFLRVVRRASCRWSPGSSSAISDFVRGAVRLLIVIGIVAAVVAVRRVGAAAGTEGAVRSPRCSACRCSATSRAKFATSQMARTLATLLGGGLPLVNALDIAARVGRQPVHGAANSTSSARACAKACRSRRRSRRGSVFPEVAVKMAEVGESTGALQDMLNTVADFYDEEISTNMERFVTLVEPVLLVIMGIVIAGLLLALYMPLFQLSSVLAQ